MALHRYYALPAINPEPWGVGDLYIINNAGKRIPKMAPNTQLQNYQNAVKMELEKQGITKLVDRECELTFYFWRRLDRYVTPSDRGHMRHVADVTNLQKALEDALQGALLTNDKLVQRVTSEIVEQTPNTHPGIIIHMKTPYRGSELLGVPGDLLLKFHDERGRADDFDLSDNLIA